MTTRARPWPSPPRWWRGNAATMGDDQQPQVDQHRDEGNRVLGKHEREHRFQFTCSVAKA